MDTAVLQQEINTLRQGPRPLPVHIGVVMSDYVRNPGRYPDIAADLAGMVAGIRAYQDSPFKRPVMSSDIVWREGEVTLNRIPARGAVRARVVLVPSLINRSYILDLLPERSFARWLAGQGMEVFLLDWGAPVNDPGLKTLEGINDRLRQAIRFLAGWQDAADLYALGYCMGGTLLALAGLRDDVAGQVFLASPWDFHAGDRALADHIRMGAPAALQMIEAGGVLPAGWIQSIFAAVNADRAVRKFADFAAFDPAGDKARMFVVVEDWLNDGVDFPGPLARTCIMDWYVGNSLPPPVLSARSLVVASGSDRLVPLESSLALTEYLDAAVVLKPSIGHIGMMTGAKAQGLVWEPLRDWILQG